MSGPVDPPFAYRIGKDGTIRISRSGRVVTVLRGPRAERLAAKLRALTPDARQQLLARTTGDYRRGNERRARPGGDPG